MPKHRHHSKQIRIDPIIQTRFRLMKLIDCALCYLAIRDLYTYKMKFLVATLTSEFSLLYILLRGGGATHKISGVHPLNIRGGGNFAIINPVNM